MGTGQGDIVGARCYYRALEDDSLTGIVGLSNRYFSSELSRIQAIPYHYGEIYSCTRGDLVPFIVSKGGDGKLIGC